MQSTPRGGGVAGVQSEDLGCAGTAPDSHADSTSSSLDPKNQTRPFLESRNARRQRLVQHLHDAGPRPTLEVLLAVEKGQPLDLVLSEFARVPVATYHATGASELPINQRLAVINGGRDD
jgi:hypothetical protein